MVFALRLRATGSILMNTAVGRQKFEEVDVVDLIAAKIADDLQSALDRFATIASGSRPPE